MSWRGIAGEKAVPPSGGHIHPGEGQDSHEDGARNGLWMPLALEDAVFLQRLSRFSARVLWRGQEVLAHVPNSGRLRELLAPGVRARVRPGGGPKTACRLMMVEHEQAWALIDAHLTNDIMEYAVQAGWLMPDPFDLHREVRYAGSRLDLGCRNAEGVHLVEAKCVTLVQDGLALFPDAPTERGTRHLRELASAQRAGLNGHIAFFVQQPGARAFAANRVMDPAFADALGQAAAAGVKVHVIQCRIAPDGVGLCGRLPLAAEDSTF